MPQPAELHAAPPRVEYAAWRYWAALVRDREGPHQQIGEDVATTAAILARLLDVWDDCRQRDGSQPSARNLTSGLEATIEVLVSRILAAGVAPPSLPAGLRPQSAVRTYRETLRHIKETALQAARTWQELTPADRERLLSPVAFLASVARLLTQTGPASSGLGPTAGEPRSS